MMAGNYDNITGPVRDALQNALRVRLNNPDFAIASVDVIRPDDNKGNNYGSFIRYVRITPAAGPEINLFMKVLGDTDVHKMFEATSRICEREWQFFTNILPEIKSAAGGRIHLDAVLPVCYYGDKSTVIMENLVNNGFRMVAVQETKDLPHVTLVIKALADIHAASYSFKKRLSGPVTDKYPILREALYIPETKVTMGAIIKNTGENMVGTLIGDPSCERQLAAFQKLLPHLFDIGNHVLRPEEPFNVICHGDPWSNNIMFSYDDKGVPNGVKLVDLQLPRYAPAVTDLMYFLYSSTTTEFRRNHLESVLRTYYDHFTSSIGGKCDYSYDQFCQHYKDRQMYAVVVTAMFLRARHVPNEAAVDIEQMTDIDDIENSFKNYETTEAGSQLGLAAKVKADLLAFYDEFKTVIEECVASLK